MAKNIHGGGANTNINGLKFEQETNIKDALHNLKDYSLNGNEVSYNQEKVALIISKHALYKDFLELHKINYKEFISKKLLPDEAIYSIKGNTVYIIEKKFQNVSGSVDEKLQSCDFKLKQYKKLFSPLNIHVEYVYVLNDWFKQVEYTDVLNYIHDMNCHYFFNKIPLSFLQLPE